MMTIGTHWKPYGYSSVFNVGLFGSGSTWVVNVSSDIIKLYLMNASVSIKYYEDFSCVFGVDRPVSDTWIIKQHAPIGVEGWLEQLSSCPVIISVRDPRDAVVSLMQRFGKTFIDALDDISRSAAAIMEVTQKLNPLVLRYEDGFTVGEGGVRQIADYLGCSLSSEDVQRLAAKYTPDAVRETIRRLQQEDAFTAGEGAAQQYHPETHWHPGHVGDGQVGKYWDHLTKAEIAGVQSTLQDFMRRFNYGFENVSSEAIRELWKEQRDMGCAVTRLQKRTKELEEQLSGLYASSSWRMTAPLRKVLTFLR